MTATSKGATATPIPWTSWLALAGFLIGAGILVLLTSRTALPDWLRWTVTGLWVAFTLALGIYDFFLGGGEAAARARQAAAIDVKPVDRWTISHTGAGLVFGVWFVPLVWMLLIVVAWEFFEKYVRGFGEKEILANRAVDVGVAAAGWLVVVIIGVIATGAGFPFI